MTPILLLGAGRMGGALIEGWLKAGAFAASDIMVRDPRPGPLPPGVRINPADQDLAAAKTVVLAVKPQIWRETAGVAAHLAPDAVIVSVAAGVRAADIAQAFARKVARVMPTTAVAIGQGTASLYADDPVARARARALLEPVATVVDLPNEGLMHAATAVSGSGPAYLYAFVEALEAAGVEAGLDEAASRQLARSTVTGAAALLAQSGAEPSDLRKQVTSPGGTTQAALEVILAELPDLMARAVAAAARRSEELGS
ncbi:MAG TPA: pyrroline-5-carboxylate reductase [Caulobacteraceae bacterium]